MHSMGIIHRDLKPENIIFTDDLHLKITEFETAKMLDSKEEQSPKTQKGTILGTIGTLEYITPVSLILKLKEYLNQKELTAASDLWNVGCIFILIKKGIIYQMITGNHLFSERSSYLIFQKILSSEIEFSEDIPENAKDLIYQLIQIKPEDRLGVKEGGYSLLKAHKFFESINWDDLNEQKIKPPLMHDLINVEEDKFNLKRESEISNEKTEIQNEVNELKKWEVFLCLKEKIFYTSPIIIKKNEFLKRQLILTDMPRLIIIDPQKMQIEVAIEWCESIQAIAINENIFEIIVPGKKYLIEDQLCNVGEWINKIETMKKQKTI
jgi:3-phosphoinositide dependent protein kinase-1